MWDIDVRCKAFLYRIKRDHSEQIVNGVMPTKPVKTVVAIMHRDPVTDMYMPVCSGTLIGNTWVATAGHCFTNASLADMKVVAGEMNLRAYYIGASKTAKTVRIKEVHLPKKYHRIGNKVLDNDLALIELAESLDVSMDSNLEKAFLPPPGMKIAGEEFQVVGWGKIGKYMRQSSSLLSIEVSISQDQNCGATHGQTKYFPQRMFCGGMETGTTCNGDSGGGAIFHGWGVPVILGVVSFGTGDCKTSAVYTRIDAFLPWIFQLTKIQYVYSF